MYIPKSIILKILLKKIQITNKNRHTNKALPQVNVNRKRMININYVLSK